MERAKLLESISNTVSDYQIGAKPAPEHVNKWVNQFKSDEQIPLLREMDHVLKSTYFSKSNVTEFLEDRLTDSELTSANPYEFWKNANFLNIQKNGNSQHEMLKIFDECLKRKFSININACGSPAGDFIYLDDVIFSGYRVINDLKTWVENDAPAKAVARVIATIIHANGKWQIGNQLNKAIKASGKKIVIKYHSKKTIDNRKQYKRGVLWPTILPDDPNLLKYLKSLSKYPFEPSVV